MFVHANIATVPAFAPVHEYADWYWAFLETKPDMVLHPTCPLPEVVAWHREHAGGRPFDDFIPQLTFERFDADEYAQLLDDAGMRYLVHVTKHHDGFCWWDTALHRPRSSVHARARSVTSPPSWPTRCAAAGTCSAATTRCSTGATPSIPTRSATSTRSCARRSRSWSSGSSPRCSGATATGATRAALARRPDPRRRPRGRGASAGSSSCSTTAGSRRSHDYAVYEYDVPDGRARRSVGAVPRARLLVLREPQRARRRPPHRRAGRRAARRDGRQGRQPACSTSGRTPTAPCPSIQARVLRDSGAWVRAHADAIHGSTPLRRSGRRAALVHARGRAGARVRPRVGRRSRASPASTRRSACTTPDGAELPFRVDAGVLAIDAAAVERHPFGTRYVRRARARAIT